jgi:hypothetical protein
LITPSRPIAYIKRDTPAFPHDPKNYFEDVAATQPDILLLVGGSLFQSYVLATDDKDYTSDKCC